MLPIDKSEFNSVAALPFGSKVSRVEGVSLDDRIVFEGPPVHVRRQRGIANRNLVGGRYVPVDAVEIKEEALFGLIRVSVWPDIGGLKELHALQFMILSVGGKPG